MESKISKAQLEVWEWKEKAWQETRNLPKEEQLPFILSQTQETVAMIQAAKAKNNLNRATTNQSSM